MLEWVPNICYGEFFFGEDINKYIDVYNLIQDMETPDSTGWRQYRVPGKEVYIEAEHGKVVSILCYEEFFYKGTNIISSSLDDLEKLLGSACADIGDSVVYFDGDEQTPVDFDPLGLQVWVDSSRQIQSISCYRYQLDK